MPWVNFELPDDLHRRARSKAALRGEKFYAYLVELIRQGVEGDEKADAEAEHRRRQ